MLHKGIQIRELHQKLRKFLSSEENHQPDGVFYSGIVVGQEPAVSDPVNPGAPLLLHFRFILLERNRRHEDRKKNRMVSCVFTININNRCYIGRLVERMFSYLWIPT